MNESNNSFIFYKSFADAASCLDDAHFRQVMCVLFDYAFNGIIPESDDMIIMMAFYYMKKLVDINTERRSNGKTGGRPPKKSHDSDNGEADKAENDVPPSQKPYFQNEKPYFQNEKPYFRDKKPYFQNEKPNVNVNVDVDENVNVNVNEDANVDANVDADVNSDPPTSPLNQGGGASGAKPACAIARKRKSGETKHQHGEYKHVLLTDSELYKLYGDYGESETEAAIKYLDEHIEMKHYKASSHYLAMRKWVFNAVKEERLKAERLKRMETNLARSPNDTNNPFLRLLREEEGGDDP